MVFSLVIGIPSGVLASVRVGRFWDSAGKAVSRCSACRCRPFGSAWCDPRLSVYLRLVARHRAPELRSI